LKLVNLFTPLIVVALLLSACGDSSVTRQDVVDFMVDTIQEEELMVAEVVSREALVEFWGCVIDEIKAVSGDSYETILDEFKMAAEDDSNETEYEVILNEEATGCLVDSREVLEGSMNAFFPEDMQVDLSGVDNFHREALAVTFRWSMSIFMLEEMLDDAGYCMADYVADNSGDSHRDILIDFLYDESAYDVVLEEASEACLDF